MINNELYQPNSKETKKNIDNKIHITEFLKKDGLLLRILPKTVSNNKEMVLIAVVQNPKAFNYAALFLKQDHAFIKLLIAKNLGNNKYFLMTVLENNPNFIELDYIRKLPLLKNIQFKFPLDSLNTHKYSTNSSNDFEKNVLLKRRPSVHQSVLPFRSG